LVLPPQAASAELRGDAEDPWLWPQEETAIAGAADRRRREYASVRACARVALAQIGLPPYPLVPGERGAPSWPHGVVGSMTHCEGFRGAAVARRHEIIQLGIDAEPDEPLPEGVFETISTTDERIRGAWLHQEHPGVPWDRVLFSAKESVYKAWFPLSGEWLDFEQANIRIDPSGSFGVEFLMPNASAASMEFGHYCGRWLQCRGLVLTTAVVPSTDEALGPTTGQ